MFSLEGLIFSEFLLHETFEVFGTICVFSLFINDLFGGKRGADRALPAAKPSKGGL